jgi:hypothetical protein
MITNWAAATSCLALLGVMFSTPARAAVTEDNFLLRNAADLVAVCSAPAGDPMMTAAVNFCDGFTVGVYRTLAAEQAAMQSKLFCVVGPVPTRSEAVARFVAWAQSRPDVLSEQPEDAILAYLQVRFPCASPH